MDIVDLLWLLHNDPGMDLSAEQTRLLSEDSLDFDPGQKAQLELLQRWLDQGHHLGGWKIGMTSGANRNAMGDGVRPFGFVLKERIFTSGATLDLAGLHKGQVENELALLMGRDLGEGATGDSAFAAVQAILPAFEINQKRLPGKASAGLRVADDLSNYGIVVGAPVTPVRNLSGMCVTLSDGSGEEIESVNSANHIDDHYESLAILARRLHQFGQTLKAGQYVITGAYGKTPFAPGRYVGHFDQGVGTVEVTLQ